jgi:hypothetical protein
LSSQRVADLLQRQLAALIAQPKRKKRVLKNRTAPEIEESVVAMAIEQPPWG